MSYAFLLKYIIIGDSGTSVGFMQGSANHVCFFSTLTSDIETNIKSPLESSLGLRLLPLAEIILNCKFGTL